MLSTGAVNTNTKSKRCLGWLWWAQYGVLYFFSSALGGKCRLKLNSPFGVCVRKTACSWFIALGRTAKLRKGKNLCHLPHPVPSPLLRSEDAACPLYLNPSDHLLSEIKARGLTGHYVQIIPLPCCFQRLSFLAT